MKHSIPLVIPFFIFLAPACTSQIVWCDEKKTNEDLLRDSAKNLSFMELFEHGNALVGSDVNKAIAYYRKALTLKTDYPQVHFNLGICLSRIGKHDEALCCFDEAIRLQPSYAKAYVQRGIILKNQDKKFEALEALNQAIKHDPKSWEAYYQLGLASRDINQFDAAIKHLQTSISLNPSNIVTLFELATTYHMVENTQACLALYEKILELAPGNISALYNYGFTLKKLGNIKEAMTIYDQVLVKDPNYAQAHFSRSLANLTLGNFGPGWEEYESRWRAYNENPQKYDSPLYEGENPAGQTILIYSEQGLGDTFQFIRYGKLLHDQGARVIAIVQRPLKTLLSLLPYLDIVITNGDQVPRHDAHIALMSLPRVCKTLLDSVPHEVPYLYADKALDAFWHKKLSQDTRFKIGICWQGNAHYRTQFLRQAVAAKSMQLQDFMPLASLEGIALYNIQKINGMEQVLVLEKQLPMVSFDESFDRDHGRFMDTAAVIKNLDLVITIDTSIAHLAGGLGVPTWVLLPYPADWRWMLDSADTPWYPTMRLFRQQKTGDWASVIHTITSLLTPLVELHQKIRTTGNPLHAEVAELNLFFNKGELNSLLIETPVLSDAAQLKEKTYLSQLTSLNDLLWSLESQLHQKPLSIFDQSFIELSKKISATTEEKTRIKTELNALYTLAH